MFIIKTRRQAAEAGEKRYYTGRPCSKGHDAQRFTSTGVCVQCAAGYVKEYNKRLVRQANANAAGIFTYPLHPDDVAAALAYCQALDLQRGRAPHVPAAPVAMPPAFDAAAARALALGKAVDIAAPAAPAYLPKP
jgi:hypothetical protein